MKLVPDQYERLQLNTFGDTHHKSKGCDVVQVSLCKSGSSAHIKFTALAICMTLPSVADVQNFEHLTGLQLADNLDNPQETIDILIGSDFYLNIVTGDVRMGARGPIAISSRLLSGPIESSSVTNLVSSHIIISGGAEGKHLSLNSDQLNDLLKQFWETETLGITQHELERCNEEVHYSLHLFTSRDQIYRWSL